MSAIALIDQVFTTVENQFETRGEGITARQVFDFLKAAGGTAGYAEVQKCLRELEAEHTITSDGTVGARGQRTFRPHGSEPTAKPVVAPTPNKAKPARTKPAPKPAEAKRQTQAGVRVKQLTGDSLVAHCLVVAGSQQKALSQPGVDIPAVIAIAKKAMRNSAAWKELEALQARNPNQALRYWRFIRLTAQKASAGK